MSQISTSSIGEEYFSDQNSQMPGARTLVIIDSSVGELELLKTALKPGAEVAVLHPQFDGIEQITALISRRQDIQKVHLVSHGSSGSLKLGASELNSGNINQYSTQLKSWFVNSGNSVSLSVYGCQVADGVAGQSFIQQLRDLTGADIAAATQTVGSPSRGGVWQLDYRLGAADPEMAFSDEVIQSYSGTFMNEETALNMTNEVIDLSNLTEEDSVFVTFNVDRAARSDNTVDFYEVNADGSVVDPDSGETIAVDQEGYTEAAVANRFGLDLATKPGETSQFSAELEGGRIYAPLIAVDSGIEALTDDNPENDPTVYFTYPEANADGFDHVRRSQFNVFEFEDLPNGGDLDFDDLVIEASLDSAEISSLSPEPVVEEPVVEPVVEEPVEEAPIEEPVVEEPVEEAPIEEPVAETPVEEPVAGEFGFIDSDVRLEQFFPNLESPLIPTAEAANAGENFAIQNVDPTGLEFVTRELGFDFDEFPESGFGYRIDLAEDTITFETPFTSLDLPSEGDFYGFTITDESGTIAPIEDVTVDSEINAVGLSDSDITFTEDSITVNLIGLDANDELLADTQLNVEFAAEAPAEEPVVEEPVVEEPVAEAPIEEPVVEEPVEEPVVEEPVEEPTEPTEPVDLDAPQELALQIFSPDDTPLFEVDTETGESIETGFIDNFSRENAGDGAVFRTSVGGEPESLVTTLAAQQFYDNNPDVTGPGLSDTGFVVQVVDSNTLAYTHPFPGTNFISTEDDFIDLTGIDYRIEITDLSGNVGSFASADVDEVFTSVNVGDEDIIATEDTLSISLGGNSYNRGDAVLVDFTEDIFSIESTQENLRNPGLTNDQFTNDFNTFI